MKVKLIDVYSSVGVLNKLIEEPLPTKISYKMMKLLGVLNGEVKLVEDQRLKLVKQYSEDGVSVTDDKKEQFLKEFSSFLDVEVDVDWEPISVESFGENLKLSVVDLAKIHYLLKE
jgi:hypothetical protein